MVSDEEMLRCRSLDVQIIETETVSGKVVALLGKIDVIGVWRGYGNCLEGVWWVSEGCLAGVLWLSGWCLNGVRKVY